MKGAVYSYCDTTDKANDTVVIKNPLLLSHESQINKEEEPKEILDEV